jgi:CBS domain-containing protein
MHTCHNNAETADGLPILPAKGCCKKQTPASRARDLMTPEPVSVTASTTPRELARTFTQKNISGAPVVDASGRVIGVVSRTNLLEWCVRGGLGFGARDLIETIAEGRNGTRIDTADLGIVADFMCAQSLLCAPDDTLDSLAERMSKLGVHRIIVVNEDRVAIGIITSLDLLRTYPKPEHHTSSAQECCCRG